MTENAYIEALRKTKTSDTKMILSPKRQLVEHQNKRCYLCEKSLDNMTCYFEVVEGPDMVIGVVSKEQRALCPPCRFSLGKNPVKQVKKAKDIKAKKDKEKKAKDDELNLFKELNLRKAKRKGYDEFEEDEEF